MNMVRLMVLLGGALPGLGLSILPSCSSTEEPGNRAPLPPAPQDAAELLERCIRSLGGKELAFAPGAVHRRSRVCFYPTEDILLEGELEYWRQGEHERLELRTDDGQELVQVWTPEGGQEWENGRKTGRDLGDEAQRRARSRNLLEHLCADPGARWADTAKVDDELQYVLETEFENGELWRMWIDARDSTPRRILCSEPVGGSRRIRQDFLFEARSVEGRWVPFRQVGTVDGKKVSESWLLQMDLGQMAAPELFSVDNLYNL